MLYRTLNDRDSHNCNYINEETGIADDTVTDEDSIKDIYDIEIAGKMWHVAALSSNEPGTFEHVEL